MGTSLYADLLDACAQPGCPLCRLSESAVDDHLRSFFYEKVNDRAIRERLRLSLGFCPEHASRALEPGNGDALGVSIIYNDILTNILRNLPEQTANGSEAPSGGFSLRGLFGRPAGDRAKAAVQALTPQEPCPVCKFRDSTAELNLQGFLDAMEKEEFRQALRTGDGLCLPHLRAVLPRLQTAAAFDAALEAQRAKLEVQQAELAEFIRKNDYRFQKEPIGGERNAWQRVIRWVSGWASRNKNQPG